MLIHQNDLKQRLLNVDDNSIFMENVNDSTINSAIFLIKVEWKFNQSQEKIKSFKNSGKIAKKIEL